MTANPFSDTLYRVTSDEYIDNGKTVDIPGTFQVPVIEALAPISTWSLSTASSADTSPTDTSPTDTSPTNASPASTAPSTPPPYTPLSWSDTDLSESTYPVSPRRLFHLLTPPSLSPRHPLPNPDLLRQHGRRIPPHQPAGPLLPSPFGPRATHHLHPGTPDRLRAHRTHRHRSPPHTQPRRHRHGPHAPARPQSTCCLHHGGLRQGRLGVCSGVLHPPGRLARARHRSTALPAPRD
ncbi:hypothetical protein P171DRAFT_45484 [Karstenula rhodostoma CBS 690.94]|uniref:Uncharacterized protein n=1 Tax=Karstenula rhodostoma CBS 690.94 TaxID=1392251 RepID=A0A9P4PH70_9PLEO|nr:hypothetical protein P171DRAFT_45484 [Karstenula rhodostoma CBS 690.94]